MMGSAFFRMLDEASNRMLCSSWLLNLPNGGDHYSSVNDLGTHWNFAAYLVLFVVLFSVIFISFLLLFFFFFHSFPRKVETTKCLRKLVYASFILSEKALANVEYLFDVHSKLDCSLCFLKNLWNTFCFLKYK